MSTHMTTQTTFGLDGGRVMGGLTLKDACTSASSLITTALGLNPGLGLTVPKNTNELEFSIQNIRYSGENRTNHVATCHMKEERYAAHHNTTCVSRDESDSEEEGEIREEKTAHQSVDSYSEEEGEIRGKKSTNQSIDDFTIKGIATFPNQRSAYTLSSGGTSTTSFAHSGSSRNFPSWKHRARVEKNKGRVQHKGRKPTLLMQLAKHKMKAFNDLAAGKPVVALMRKTDIIQDPNKLLLGTIISAPHHTMGRTDHIAPGDTNMSYSMFGPVHSKYRKMIILESWGEHFTCLPLYSYQGRGLETRKHFSDEYISVRNEDEENWEPRETPTPPLRAKRDPKWKHQFVSGRTVVKLTEKCNFYFKWEKCSIEGYILPEDFQDLCQEHHDILGKKKDESIRESRSREYYSGVNISRLRSFLAQDIGQRDVEYPAGLEDSI